MMAKRNMSGMHEIPLGHLLFFLFLPNSFFSFYIPELRLYLILWQRALEIGSLCLHGFHLSPLLMLSLLLTSRSSSLTDCLSCWLQTAIRYCSHDCIMSVPCNKFLIMYAYFLGVLFLWLSPEWYIYLPPFLTWSNFAVLIPPSWPGPYFRVLALTLFSHYTFLHTHSSWTSSSVSNNCHLYPLSF